MDNENKTLIEQIESPDEVVTPNDDDQLKKAVEDQLSKIRTQSILLGAQTSCSVILQKIIAWDAQPGKRTLNDHRRLIKDLRQFCEVGISRKVNPDGTTSPKEENNTKLTDEEDDNE